MENKLYEVINLKLQAHKTPVFKEEKQKEWIIYGADREGGYYNNYPAYLLYLYNRSSKHNSFINGKVLYICGAGVGFDSEGLTLQDIALANDFINKEKLKITQQMHMITICTIRNHPYLKILKSFFINSKIYNFILIPNQENN